VSNLRFSSAYTTKKSTISDATKASVTASSTAVNGTQTLEIKSVAQSGYMTGGKINTVKETNRDETDTKLSELGYTGGDTSFDVVLGDGTKKTIQLTKATKISDIVSALGEAGLNANFDTNQGRFYISSKTTGEASDFTFVPSTTSKDSDGNTSKKSSDAVDALNALGLATENQASKGEAAGDLTITATGQGSDGSTATTTLTISFKDYAPSSQEEADAQNAFIDAIRKGEYTTTYDPNTNQPIFKLNGYVMEGSTVWKADADGNKTSEKVASFSQTSSGTNADGSAPADTDFYKNITWGAASVTKGADATYSFKGKAAGNLTISATGQGSDGSTASTTLTISFKDYAPSTKEEADAQNEFINAIRKGEYTTTYDPNTNQPIFKLKGYVMEGGVISKADADGNATSETVASFSYKSSGTNADGSAASGTDFNDITWDAASVTKGVDATYSFATKIDGSDSAIILNNVEYTSTTNSFSINGLSINALAETDGPITITTATDTQAIYDKVKDFLTEYNSIINEMTKLYNADSSYGYDPLTDDEKDAMSDTEIEKWETKIKDSLLRNDTTLNGVMMAMINSMSSSYTINGQKYTLSSFGIATLGYLNAAENENYAYHIDGDSDDDNTSSKDDKLMKAITEDPDTVIEFMKQLTSGLYTSLGNKMKSTTLSSAYTIYNDKEMNSQYSEYSTTISKWEDKLSDKEDYYYEKFAQMESALTKLQSQSSSVTGLFSS
jgi:flagellar hook-associated protein 2